MGIVKDRFCESSILGCQGQFSCLKNLYDMLQQFTWGQFLLASFVLSFLWYGFVLVVFFRREVSAFFGSGEVSSPLPHRWEKGVESLSDAGSGGALVDEDLGSELMGKSRIRENSVNERATCGRGSR